MISIPQNKTKLASIALLLSCSSSVFAVGANISFTSLQHTAVPTLSSTMLIVLSLLLFVVAFKVSKQKNNAASKLFVSLLGISAITLGGGGGVKLISEAKAGIFTTAPITSGHHKNTNSGYNGFLQNTTGQNLIVTITADDDSVCGMVGVSYDNNNQPVQDPNSSCGNTLNGPLPSLGNTAVNAITMTPNQTCYLRCGANGGGIPN